MGEHNEAPFKGQKTAKKPIKKELIIGLCAGVLIALIGMVLLNHKPAARKRKSLV